MPMVKEHVCTYGSLILYRGGARFVHAVIAKCVTIRVLNRKELKLRSHFTRKSQINERGVLLLVFGVYEHTCEV